MTLIHFVVLFINTAVMIAGLLAGPVAAGTAFFAISIGLGAYRAGAGRPATKTAIVGVLPDFLLDAHAQVSGKRAPIHGKRP